MLDVKLLRENYDELVEKLLPRGVKEEELAEFKQLDEQRREKIVETEQLKQVRNQVSQDIARLKREKEDADEKIAEMKKVGDQIKQLLNISKYTLSRQLKKVLTIPGCQKERMRAKFICPARKFYQFVPMQNF